MTTASTVDRFSPMKYVVRGRRVGSKILADLDAGSAGTPSARPTPDMIEDARLRNRAPRSITSWICGDPPPGQSALDKRTR